MTCHSCRVLCKRFGKHRNGLQRFRCNLCKKTFTEDHERPLDDMRLPLDKAVSVLRLLLEGCSIRSVERLTEVHRDTILRLLVLAGERCQGLMQRKIEHLDVADVEVDEIEVMPRDVLLFCSDGLTRMVTEPEIAGTLQAETDPESAAKKLVELANDRGGLDNVTVIVVRAQDESKGWFSWLRRDSGKKE